MTSPTAPGSRRLAGLGLLALPAAALAADSVQLNAGRWEEKLTVQSATHGGRAIPLSALGSPGDPQFTCIPAAEAADPKLYFTKSQSSQGCAAPTGTVAGGTMDLSGTCAAPGSAPMAMRLQGSYGGGAYRGIATATVEANGQPMVIRTLIEGRHVGECTGDEDGE